MTAEAFFASRASIHWMTPRDIVEAAKLALGGKIDLDPCPAADPRWHYATENWRLGGDHSSLYDDWGGRSFLINHPFGESFIRGGVCISRKELKDQGLSDTWEEEGWVRQTGDKWARKVAVEVGMGCSGVWISKASMETPGMQRLASIATLVHFPKGRTSYLDAITGEPVGSPTFHSVIMLFGGDPKAFQAALSRGVHLRGMDRS